MPPDRVARSVTAIACVVFGASCNAISGVGDYHFGDSGTSSGMVTSPTCSDGKQDETESDVDCGGDCGPCAYGHTCKGASDCFGACTGGICVAPLVPRWVNAKPKHAPSERLGPAMTYDAVRGNVVLFGGSDAPNMKYFGDTWIYDGEDWNEGTVNGPSGRAEPMMAFDNAAGLVILFGGVDGASVLGDTFTFDGTTWSAVTTTKTPESRSDGSMVYGKAVGGTILFGGRDPSVHSDLWQLSPTDATWTQEVFDGPSARSNATAVYAEKTRQMLIFGGFNGSDPLGDFWALGATGWKRITAKGDKPSARSGEGLAYDGDRGVTVLFGGAETTATDRLATWEWDGKVWSRSKASGPPTSESTVMAYDIKRHRAVLFIADRASPETWEYVLDGGTCKTDGQCGSGACENGVCCEQHCGTCEACNTKASPGSCAKVACD